MTLKWINKDQLTPFNSNRRQSKVHSKKSSRNSKFNKKSKREFEVDNHLEESILQQSNPITHIPKTVFNYFKGSKPSDRKDEDLSSSLSIDSDEKDPHSERIYKIFLI
jgi:hypothetical protein